MPIAACPDCGSEHLGQPCGMSFAQRLSTVQLHAGVLESRTKRNYYDRESVEEAFGSDAEEAYLEETLGLGAPKRIGGREYVYADPKTGERRPIEESDILGGYLRGPVEEMDPAELERDAGDFETEPVPADA